MTQRQIICCSCEFVVEANTADHMRELWKRDHVLFILTSPIELVNVLGALIRFRWYLFFIFFI